MPESNPLFWTNRPPSKEGWYFFKKHRDHKPIVVECVLITIKNTRGKDVSTGLYQVRSSELELCAPLKELDGSIWAGPIQLPQSKAVKRVYVRGSRKRKPPCPTSPT